MSCTSPFYVAKGSEAKLTVNLQQTSGNVPKIRVWFQENTIGITATPKTQDITLVSGVGVAEFTVKAAASTSDPKPFFYIYGLGLNANNSTNGQRQKDCGQIQWTF